MNFVELFCSTQGRVGRGLYWSCFGIWFVVDILLRGSVSAVAAFTDDERLIAVAFWLWVAFGIATYFPMTALLVKRLHDTGRSGFWTMFQHLFLLALFMLIASVARMSTGSLFTWLMVMLVCGLGMLVVFVFTLLDSEDSSNEYGMAH
jgi:uncharacterized membrane protein YhaH (DUF805 family)